jgi:hypothetical protein
VRSTYAHEIRKVFGALEVRSDNILRVNKVNQQVPTPFVAFHPSASKFISTCCNVSQHSQAQHRIMGEKIGFEEETESITVLILICMAFIYIFLVPQATA